MKLYEYRIVFPTTVDKYKGGLLYTTEQMSKDSDSIMTTEGIEIKADEPYQTETETGHYMYTAMHNKSRLPAFLRLVIPNKYLTFESKRWDAYPHDRSEMTNPGMGDDFLVTMESRVVPYQASAPFPDNLIDLTPEQLALRKIVWLDIVDGKPQPDKKDTIRGFQCPDGGVIAPLTGSKKGKPDEDKPPAWAQSYPGDMICVVRVTQVKFKWKGLQTMMEKNVLSMNKTMSLDMHRRMVRGAAAWFRMTPEEVHAIEERFQAAIRQGSVSAEQAAAQAASAADEPDPPGDVPPPVPAGSDGANSD
jgi:hypothetical protein